VVVERESGDSMVVVVVVVIVSGSKRFVLMAMSI